MKTYIFICFSILYFGFDALSQNQCLDPSFGNAGIVQLNFGTDSIFPKSIALQQDGKIVVGSDILISHNRDFMLNRFNTDGSLDINFGNNGSFIFDFDNNSQDHLKKIIVLPSGKILIGGNSKIDSLHKFTFVRVNNTGTIDNTFGINGKISHFVNLNEHHFLQDMVVNNLEKIDFVGQSGIEETDFYYNYSSFQQNYVVQLNADGSIDNTFNNNGISLLPAVGNYLFANKIVLLQNQAIVVSGLKIPIMGGHHKVFVSKINVNGVLDLSFGINGFSEMNSVTQTIVPKQLLIDVNDKIFVQANTGDNGVWLFNAWELNNSGVIENNIYYNYIFYFTNLFKNLTTFKYNGSYINFTDSYNYHDTIFAGDFKLFTINSQYNLATNVCGQGEIFTGVAPDVQDSSVGAVMQADNKFIQFGSSGFNTITLIRYLNTVFANNQEIFEDEKLPTIYPNPVCSAISIKNGKGQIQITDITGRIIQTLSVNQDDISIDVSAYGKGIYFISFIDKNHQPFSLKFIKE